MSLILLLALYPRADGSVFVAIQEIDLDGRERLTDLTLVRDDRSYWYANDQRHEEEYGQYVCDVLTELIAVGNFFDNREVSA